MHSQKKCIPPHIAQRWNRLLLTAWRLFNLAYFLSCDSQLDSKERTFLGEYFATYFIIGSLIDFYQCIKESNLTTADVYEEKNTGIVKTLKSNDAITIKFSSLILDKQLNRLFTHNVELDLSKNIVFDQLNHIEELLSKLKTSVQSEHKPKSHRFFPYYYNNMDMLSKARFADWILFPGFYNGKFLASFLQLNETLSFSLATSVAVINLIATSKESEILHKIGFYLNLNNLRHHHENWFSFPPTCVGQQMTRYIGVSRGGLKILRDALNYIYEAEKHIAAMIQEGHITNPSIIRDLETFNFLLFEKHAESAEFDLHVGRKYH